MSQPSETHGNAWQPAKLVLNTDSVPHKDMQGDRTVTCQSSFSFTRRFKKFCQLFDSLLTHNWTDNGDWARLVWPGTVWGCFQSCKRRSTGADIRPRTRLHGNHSTSKYDELVFVSLFRAFSLSSDQLEWAIKSAPHKERPRNEMLGLDGSSSRQQCWTGTTMSDSIRLDEPETWHRNLEYSTDFEPEERRQEKPGCNCSAKWKLGWCSICLCFIDVVLYKEDTTPSLFRTRFVGCYALPCISIELWRSTCKPYISTQPTRPPWCLSLRRLTASKE